MNTGIGQTHDAFSFSVEERLAGALHQHRDVLPTATDILIAASKHLCLGNHAKRARPLLTMYFGDALGLARHQLIDAAVVSELIHSASLLHDDVVDNATTRRGRPTVNHQWNNSVSVLAGNYLLSVSFSILKNSPRACLHDAVDVISHMTQAAMAEISIRGRLNVSTQEWHSIAVGKTGALFAWCGQAAARVANDDDAAARFYQCGLHIGAAFQLADDIRDLYDHEALKDRFSDIKNREPSYPILLGLSSPQIKNEIEALWANTNMCDDEVERIGELLLKQGVGKKTCETMKAKIEASLDALGPFRNTYGGKSIESWLKHLYEKAYDGFRA